MGELREIAAPCALVLSQSEKTNRVGGDYCLAVLWHFTQ